jgi:hypothetical protein
MRAEVRTAGWTMTRVGGMLSSLLLLVGVLEAQAQNLVQNPGFTSDLSGWTPISSPNYTVAWDGAFGVNAPGSASFDLPSSLSNMNFYFLHQCVPVAASTAYDVGGTFLYPGAVETIPASGFVLSPYSTPDSTGPALGGFDFGLSYTTSPPNTWLTTTYPRGLITPAGTASVRLLLRFTTTAAGAAHGWYDDIRLSASPLVYFTLPPCRVVDTRDLGAAIGGPVLQGQETRPFAVGGNCGIPAGAKAISLNLTATPSSSPSTPAARWPHSSDSRWAPRSTWLSTSTGSSNSALEEQPALARVAGEGGRALELRAGLLEAA